MFKHSHVKPLDFELFDLIQFFPCFVTECQRVHWTAPVIMVLVINPPWSVHAIHGLKGLDAKSRRVQMAAVDMGNVSLTLTLESNIVTAHSDTEVCEPCQSKTEIFDVVIPKEGFAS